MTSRPLSRERKVIVFAVMEMRAVDDTAMAQDVTPSIPPLAAVLHCRFLSSHCSSCFRPLDRQPLLCEACDACVRYCSAACSAADSAAHASSGECRLLRDHRDCDASDVRAALRLLHAFEVLGLLPAPRRAGLTQRIGGLLAGDLERVLADGGELAERVREGAAIMSGARGRKGSPDGEISEDELVLLFMAVLTNAVEVQVSEIGAIGIAVYGPGFSWFNHSCAPNACYRFELASRHQEPDSYQSGSFRVSPSPTAAIHPPNAWKTWIRGDNGLIQGFSVYGPTVTVRSIKQIKKGEEVCVTYIDLLQSKELRHSDLQEKYGFFCCCERCSSPTLMYVDYVLNCDARDLTLNNHVARRNCEYSELSSIIDRAIEEYRSDDNPEACCNRLESMLLESFEDKDTQAVNALQWKFKLHPLHHLSFNALITLASAYRTRLYNLLCLSLDRSYNFEILKMGRAAVSYSLLLAGAAHHIFLYEPSLVATTGHFLVSAAESMLTLLEASEQWSVGERCKPASKLLSCCCQSIIQHLPLSWNEFKVTSSNILRCISVNVEHIWPFLVHELSYLENIYSPVDFSWLGLDVSASQLDDFNYVKQNPNSPVADEDMSIKDERNSLLQLAIHCFIYGSYLASIFHGPHSYLGEHFQNLLHGF